MPSVAPAAHLTVFCEAPDADAELLWTGAAAAAITLAADEGEGAKTALGDGVLEVRATGVYFTGAGDDAETLRVPMLRIAMHGVSSDDAAFEAPCLFAQLEAASGALSYGDDDDGMEMYDDGCDDVGAPQPCLDMSALGSDGAAAVEASGGGGAGLASGYLASELFCTPKDGAALKALFEAFSKAAMLNPDEDDGNDDEDDGNGAGGGWITADSGGPASVAGMADADVLWAGGAMPNLNAQQAAALAHFESVLHIGGEAQGQFEDADADEAP